MDRASINGVANEAFLTGDGTVQFTAEQRVRRFGAQQQFGILQGRHRRHDQRRPHLFANTLNVAPARGASSWAPAQGKQSFFYYPGRLRRVRRSLPDDLSFVSPGMDGRADIDLGPPLVLRSSSLGVLTTALKFHSFAILNPGNSIQVLSGVAQGRARFPSQL